jgi:hypothetical protein
MPERLNLLERGECGEIDIHTTNDGRRGWVN